MARAQAIAVSFGLLACCAPRAPAAGVAVAPADAGAQLPVPAADAAVDVGGQISPPAVHVHFALEAGAGGERTLALVSDDGVTHEIVGTVAPAHRCVAGFALPAHGTRAARDHLDVGCGAALSASALLPPASNRVELFVTAGPTVTSAKPGVRWVDVASSAPIVLDDALSDPAAPACVASDAGAAPVVEVLVEKASHLDDGAAVVHELAILVPALGIDVTTDWSSASYCHGTRYAAARRFDLRCAYADSSETRRLSVHDGALFVKTLSGSLDHAQATSLGGVALPCGATVRFPRVHLPGAKWSPTGNCPACQTARDLCADPCMEKLTDADGKLTEEGFACQGRCDATFEACWHRCMHQ